MRLLRHSPARAVRICRLTVQCLQEHLCVCKTLLDASEGTLYCCLRTSDLVLCSSHSACYKGLARQVLTPSRARHPASQLDKQVEQHMTEKGRSKKRLAILHAQMPHGKAGGPFTCGRLYGALGHDFARASASNPVWHMR